MNQTSETSKDCRVECCVLSCRRSLTMEEMSDEVGMLMGREGGEWTGKSRFRLLFLSAIPLVEMGGRGQFSDFSVVCVCPSLSDLSV